MSPHEALLEAKINGIPMLLAVSFISLTTDAEKATRSQIFLCSTLFAAPSIQALEFGAYLTKPTSSCFYVKTSKVA